MTSDHLDAFAVLVVAALMLAFVEMRLRALFARHEVREEKMHATATMLADSAAATAREASRHIDELRNAVGDVRLDLENIGAMVKMHDGRLGAVEERLMRAALMVPSPAQGPPVTSPLSTKSITRLAGVHPDLAKVILAAAEAGASFIVTEGLRSPDRQAMLVAAGKSRTLASRHIHGFAVDLAVSTPDGGVSWNRDDYKLLASTVKAMAHALGIPLVWGGDWVSFVDCPHFELAKHFYPDPPLNLAPVPTTTSVT